MAVEKTTKKRATKSTDKSANTSTKAETATPVQQKIYTEDEVQALVAAAAKKAVEEALAAQTTAPQIVQVSADEPKVVMLFQSECSPESRIDFGPNGMFGSIQGKSGTVTVAKSDWAGRFRDAMVQNLLKNRELVVLSGLTDEEREIYDVKYREGEVLTQKAFTAMLDMGDELVSIFSDLCVSNREMVARRLSSSYENGDRRVTRALVTRLNDISKRDYYGLPDGDKRKRGAFAGIIDAMNARDAG